MGGAVRPNQAVDAELGVVDGVPKITPIPPVLKGLPAGRNPLLDETLVHPIPDEPTLQQTISKFMSRFKIHAEM